MPQECLFTGDGVASIRDLAIRGVRPRVEAFTEGQLQGNSPDDLAQDVADYVMGETVELHTERPARRVARPRGRQRKPRQADIHRTVRGMGPRPRRAVRLKASG